MRFLGIDPGLGGAAAVIDDVGRLEIVDTPTLTVGKGTKRDYNVGAMYETLARLSAPYDPGLRAALESIHAMPQSGRASMFTMGKGFGIWLALLTALHIGFDLVTPQRWKGVMLDGMAKDKDASRLRALQMFPAQADLFQRKKDDGRAEAALIAEYRRRLG